MEYIDDPDLRFLEGLSSEDLNGLVEILTKDKDGKSRYTESLTSMEEYRRHCPDHRKYWKLIARELQCFGGNTFRNQTRGTGVLYREILEDVCKQQKVKFKPEDETFQLEDKLLIKFIEKLSPEQQKEMLSELQLNTLKDLAPKAILLAVQVAVKVSGPKVITDIFINSILKAVLEQGLRLAGSTAFSRALGTFAGPVGWAVTGLWTAVDLAGPAYRVTIPAVICIANLRKLALEREEF